MKKKTMALSFEESNVVHSLLTSEQRPMDEIVSEFTSKFGRARFFSVCNSLLLLLEDNKMLKSTERLIAFAILHQAYSSQPTSMNPFISYIVNRFNFYVCFCQESMVFQDTILKN
ncbi:uncharacterized protein LOC105647034 [Jatropha curcas]|uniref:uncharacterized protein LOC105647034 n=1 Tax=Jatropha curcas TaxID=180498 RepID=UPI00189502F4|nr:uncharacterized protein LOC105647034 [Jatropha curcas]